MNENGEQVYSIANVKEDQDILGYIGEQGGFDNTNTSLSDYGFFEFTLEELGLPPAEEILKSVLAIKEEVGTQGWKTSDGESSNYFGFSLTHNPDFFDPSVSIYHQTWGSSSLNQIYGRQHGIGNFKQMKNTYYDSYAFNQLPPAVDFHLGSFLKHFNCTLIRSRVAFYNMQGKRPRPSGLHVDEPPYHLFRINIPLQTSDEYILEVSGTDDTGNYLNVTKQLEVGKLYIWNTRIPHRVGISRPCNSPTDRIHLILGFSPWFDYDKRSKSFVKSKLHGMAMSDIIKNRLFINYV